MTEKGFKRPDDGDDLSTLCFYFLKAEVLLLAWREVQSELSAKDNPESLMVDVKSGYPQRQWTFWSMHLAALATVVEGWLRVKPEDDAVNRLLDDPSTGNHRHQLWEFRHGVFHFNALNNPAFFATAENQDLLRWSVHLHSEMRRYFRGQFPDEYPPLEFLTRR